ncbi:DUF3040 domain-containing protein, partial [Actinomadura rubrisoli]
MALSMEEQRILTQIEVRLSEDDPRLAHRLSRLGAARRGRRVRLIAAAAGRRVLRGVPGGRQARRLRPRRPDPAGGRRARRRDPRSVRQA